MNKQLKICYFGAYDPEYSRNKVLIKGIIQNGAIVVEVCDRSPSVMKYVKLLFKYLITKKDYDVMIVGFPGQEIMFLARLLTRKPIIFDAFTSHYGGYILDRNYFSKNSLRARYYRFVDTWSCRLADIVLLDTQAHIEFFVSEFGLPIRKFRRIFVGTDPGVFYPRELVNKSDEYIVHFHGHYIPLQGVETIIRAAKLLENEDISFNLIGKGQTYVYNRGLAEQLGVKNINFMDNVGYNKLPEQMLKADVCLGIFGRTPKTRLVIPNKLFEAIALKKPVITADTAAIRELLGDEDALLIKADDPQALAEGILRLKDERSFSSRIAENGYAVFRKLADPKILGSQLVRIIKKIK